MRGQNPYPGSPSYGTRHVSTNTYYAGYGSGSSEQPYGTYKSAGNYRDVYRHGRLCAKPTIGELLRLAEPAAIRAEAKTALDVSYAGNSPAVSARPLPFVRRQRVEHWCFYCASPLHAVSDDMQQVIRNLLEVRRAEFPKDVITGMRPEMKTSA